MVQPWCVSRFYGQLSMLAASMDRAATTLAGAYASVGEIDSSIVRARYERLLDPNHISTMRALLGMIAVTSLAALCLILA